MKRKTFRILFLLRKSRTGKNVLALILARITTNGLKSGIYIQCHVSPVKWNQTKERATGNDRLSCQVNACLDNFHASVLEIRQQLIDEGYDGNAIQIKERFTKPKHSALMFLAELGRYCEKRQAAVGIRITQLTANKHHRLLRYLTEYTKQQYRKDDLPLDMVSYEYIDGLNTFMQTAHNCKNNGAVNLLCCLKNFILYAIRNEWIEKNLFRYYKMKIDKTNVKIPLTKEELDILLKKPMPNDRLDRIRDVFCFCALTGLAFTDADHLRMENIMTDENSMQWIHKPREKTAMISNVPLLPQALRILKKYESDETCKFRGKLLPVPSNSKMNAYLKELAGICNIPKNLTTHTVSHAASKLNVFIVLLPVILIFNY